MNLIFAFIFLMSVPLSVFADDAKTGVSVRIGSVLEDIDNFVDEDDSKKESIKEHYLSFKEKSEKFRIDNLEKFTISKSKVQEERKDQSEFGTATKVLLFLHFYLLIVLIFVFSTIFTFYSVAIVLLCHILVLLWGLIKRIFRKKHEF